MSDNKTVEIGATFPTERIDLTAAIGIDNVGPGNIGPRRELGSVNKVS